MSAFLKRWTSTSDMLWTIALQLCTAENKTYLYTTINNISVKYRRQVLCLAWTTIAGNLHSEGRTVNSAFELHMANGNCCSLMKRQREHASLRWHISSSAMRYLWLQNAQLKLSTRFSAIIIHYAKWETVRWEVDYHWRRLAIDLPIVERGQREEVVEAFVTPSVLWPLFEVHRLEALLVNPCAAFLCVAFF